MSAARPAILSPVAAAVEIRAATDVAICATYVTRQSPEFLACPSPRHESDAFRRLCVDVGGYTHEEIALALDIAPGTSKSQLSRARRALRSELADAPSEEQA